MGLEDHAGCTLDRETHKEDEGRTSWTRSTWNDSGDLLVREELDPDTGEVQSRRMDTYDTLGRRVRVEVDRGGDGSIDRITTFEWQDDRLLSLRTRRGAEVTHERVYAYDEQGRMLSELRDGRIARRLLHREDGTVTSTHDVEPQERSCEHRHRRPRDPLVRIEHDYDADRNRTATRYVHVSGDITHTTYLYEDGQLVEKIRGSGSREVSLLDETGRVVAIERRRTDGSLDSRSTFERDEHGRETAWYADHDLDGSPEIWFLTRYACGPGRR